MEHEVAQDLRTVRRMDHLGVELHPEAPRAVAHRGRGQPVGARRGVETVGQRADRIAVAHPGALRIAEPVEDPGTVLDRDRGRTELTLALGDDLAAGKDVGHEVHAVADPEDREAAVEDARVDLRRVGVVHARRPAGEDHPDDPALDQLVSRHVVGEDLAVHPRLAHPPGDELDVLPAVVQHRDRFATRAESRPGHVLGAGRRHRHLSTASHP